MSCRPAESYANPRSVAELAEPLRSRVAKAIADSGGRLFLVSGKRTAFQQWILRHERCPGRECDGRCKGRPTTAVPGRSNHENTGPTRCAADMGGDLSWLHANKARYGLHFPVPGERWHAEPHGVPTATVPPFGGPPAIARKWRQILPGDSDRSIFLAGGDSNEVFEVQLRLAALAGRLRKPDMDPGPGDGQYGPRTQAAIGAFKRWIQGVQKATGQTPWPNDDPIIGSKTIAMLRYWTP